MEVLLNVVSLVSFIGIVVFGAMLDSPNFVRPLIGVGVCAMIFVISAALNGYVGDFEE